MNNWVDLVWWRIIAARASFIRVW